MTVTNTRSSPNRSAPTTSANAHPKVLGDPELASQVSLCFELTLTMIDTLPASTGL
jgi:hypothetical protein